MRPTGDGNAAKPVAIDLTENVSGETFLLNRSAENLLSPPFNLKGQMCEKVPDTSSSPQMVSMFMSAVKEMDDGDIQGTSTPVADLSSKESGSKESNAVSRNLFPANDCVKSTNQHSSQIKLTNELPSMSCSQFELTNQRSPNESFDMKSANQRPSTSTSYFKAADHRSPMVKAANQRSPAKASSGGCSTAAARLKSPLSRDALDYHRRRIGGTSPSKYSCYL